MLSTSTLGLTLAACGGGGGSDSGGIVTIVAPPTATPTPIPTFTPTAITDAQATRFLGQATMGANSAGIAELKARGFAGWIANEFAKPRATTHWDWLVANGFRDAANMNGTQGFDNVMWSQMIGAGDQLRQRIGMALLQILVVGADGMNLKWRQFAMAAYVDVLMDNAFGNFRTLLGGIVTNAAMASFLTFLNNRKANPVTGAIPDENFAREVMQLFTIGLHRLNMDGTRVLSNGHPVETYTAADVSALARVFTGLTLDSTDNSTPDRLRRPLVVDAGLHETGPSTFLGATVPAGVNATEAIRIALDTIFLHPNVPPFVSKQLIQRLVTSNPSPAYVNRVAMKFADNGTGIRGDMQAVIRAILLDEEARAEPSGVIAGKLREPVLRVTGWARAFGATSLSGKWDVGDTSDVSKRLGQAMGRASSVFNFFRPGYVPPGSAFATAELVVPEMQITNELSVIGYVNYMHWVVNNSTDLRTSYAELTGIADTGALIDRVNLLVAAGQVGHATLNKIRVAADSAKDPLIRIHTAILLLMASPEYITQR
ncbi:DUF1800 domain-containing protein [Sphingomonas turrisvirgatae]|nr:DUF1800 domain-containing protein [Sphingomonas turrisvirgatae]